LGKRDGFTGIFYTVFPADSYISCRGAGLNSATAQMASFKKIAKNELVVVDYVFAYKGYLADQMHIVSIGKLLNKLIEAPNAMLDIEALIEKR